MEPTSKPRSEELAKKRDQKKNGKKSEKTADLVQKKARGKLTNFGNQNVKDATKAGKNEVEKVGNVGPTEANQGIKRAQKKKERKKVRDAVHFNVPGIG